MGVRAPGWLGYIADFLATKPANGAYSGSPNSTGAVLLAFYELVYLNRQAFVGSLLANAGTSLSLFRSRSLLYFVNG